MWSVKNGRQPDWRALVVDSRQFGADETIGDRAHDHWCFRRARTGRGQWREVAEFPVTERIAQHFAIGTTKTNERVGWRTGWKKKMAKGTRGVISATRRKHILRRKRRNRARNLILDLGNTLNYNNNVNTLMNSYHFSLINLNLFAVVTYQHN